MEWEEIYRRLVADANDDLAWRALEQRVHHWARAALWSRGPQLVEWAVTDTCSAIAVNLRAARGPETFSGFAYGCFLNVRRCLLRDEAAAAKTQTLEGVDLAAPQAHEGPDPEVVLRLRRALAALPVRERSAVTLRYFEELPSAAIGSALGVTSGNARRIVFNGLRRLRTHLVATDVHEAGGISRPAHDAGRADPVRLAAHA